MATVYDVAKYILEKHGEMTAMKLQKLVYYSQAWHLAWEEEALFNEKIEAWVNGPVCPDLYKIHSGQFKVDSKLLDLYGTPDNLSLEQKESIDNVLGFYGDKSSQWLSDLTHAEEPWKQARDGLEQNERGNREIDLSSMFEYYNSLQ